MSKEELHNWYWSMEDILIHNHNQIMTIYQTEETTSQFIEYIHARVRQP